MRYIRYDGVEVNEAYFLNHYGPFVIKRAPVGIGERFEITALIERADGAWDHNALINLVPDLISPPKSDWDHNAKPKLKVNDKGIMATAAFVVRIIDGDTGYPVDNVEVAFYWPDADPDQSAGPLGGPPEGVIPNRCVHGPTKESGDVGFGMGGGAYYWPQYGERGPHGSWVYGANTRSDSIIGIGMVALTNHYHFDIEMTRRFDEEEPPEPPPDGVTNAEILEAIARLDSKLDYLIGLARMPRTISGVGG